ncbi:RNA-directed DNA polymerase from mobile element jockey [Trichonephila clavipes]|nr:RNA-directed DNA polymerase from mobile element jockey [Trichonephila clavipes]
MNQGFSSTIIMGDFNAKHSSWGCDVDSPRGVRLKTHIERTGYRILAPPTPMRYGHNSTSTLDFAITQNADWPCVVTSRSELSSDHNPVTRDLKQLFKDRNRARKTWHYTKSPADKNTLNKLQKQIKKIITKFEHKQWDESLTCLEAEDGTLWNAIRDFRRKAPQIPAPKGPAKIAYSDTDKSEIIADSLQNQFKLILRMTQIEQLHMSFTTT